MKPEKQLYQWDVNQYLTGINPAAQYVDYPIGNEVIRIKADGTRCRIPDEVLQTYGGKTCYERYPDGTYRAYSFSVLYAPKPPNYVYTPEERTTFEALTARVDSAIDEIKRRADSGEFTPVKGVDYFTDAEKAEMMESVSSGAVGEFRKVVDTATTEYNDNHNLKLAKYNTNAAEKLTTYDTNAEQHTTDYNRNAEVKLEAYNQNHTAKVAEYNQNAETKTAEFDSNAAALQAEVDRLRGECDNLAAENRKQENRIDALIKLNKGQTYDILPEEGETASRTTPSGAKYVSVDKVGGKSVVFEQRIKPENIGASKTENGITFTNNGDGTVTVSGTATANTSITIGSNRTIGSLKNKPFILTGCPKGGSGDTYFMGVSDDKDYFKWDKGYGYYSPDGYDYGYTLSIYIMSGTTIDTPITFKPNLFIINKSVFPSLDSFKQMFPNDYYPYCEPTIISSQTDRIDVAMADGTTTQQIPTGFPVLNSAGSVYDYIDLNEGKLHRRVGEFILTADADIALISYTEDIYLYQFMLAVNNTPNDMPNICNRFTYYTYDNRGVAWKTDGAIVSNQNGITRLATKMNMDELKTFLSANEVIIQYVLTEPVITDITIPTELTDWLPVEPGGAVTFHNSDESKKLAVPNGVSWVRKLNEVE